MFSLENVKLADPTRRISMLKKVVILTAAFLVLGGMSSAFADSWVGTVSDSMCGAKHARAGAEAATCVAKCVAGGSKYVLVSKGKIGRASCRERVEGS